MNDRYSLPVSCLIVVFLILGFLGTSTASAQSNCTNPYLGDPDPEVCVTITPTPGGTPVVLRAPAGLGDPPFPVVGPYGEYELNLVVTFAFSGTGMSLDLAGTVTRSTAGTDAITIDVEGGWAAGLPDGSGSIYLSGFGTGTSRVQQGAAAGFPAGVGPSQDIQYVGYPPICSEDIYGPRPPGNVGEFDCDIQGLPVDPGAVAVRGITVVHINDVGELVDLPGGVGSGDKVEMPEKVGLGGTYSSVTRTCPSPDNPNGCRFKTRNHVVAMPHPFFGDTNWKIPGVTAWGCEGHDGTPNSCSNYGDPNFPSTNPAGSFTSIPGDWTEFSTWADVSCPANSKTGANPPVDGVVEFNLNPGGLVARLPISCIAPGTPGMISGIKYEDVNGNGKRDPLDPPQQNEDGTPKLEPGLDGWQILLDGFPTSPPTFTGLDGTYKINEVQPGMHTVSEENREPEWFPSSDAELMVNVADGMEAKGVDFGNYRPAAIHGFKYEDINGNGIKDSEDHGISGWVMECVQVLEGESEIPCEPLATTPTSSNLLEIGAYWFEGLAPGTYKITEESRFGWEPKNPSSGFHMVTVKSGDAIGGHDPEDPPGKDFYNKPPIIVPPQLGSIHIQKFWDVNGNGNHDPGEPGINGVPITIQGIGVNLTEATHDRNPTGSNDPHLDRGWVWFHNLPLNSYTISEIVPPGFFATTVTSTTVSASATPETSIFKFGNAFELADLGDAPDETDLFPSIPEGYPTLIADDGAVHVIIPDFRMGELIDGEADGQPSDYADGDDDEDASDDEDGVTFASDFIPLALKLNPASEDLTLVWGAVIGDSGNLVINTSAAGTIDLWVDLDRNGNWEQVPSTEHIVQSLAVPAGDNIIPLAIPLGSAEGLTFMRVRFSPVGFSNVTPEGLFGPGEVEDYLMLLVSKLDLGPGDGDDANLNDGICADALGNCTLRAAIQESAASGIIILLDATTLGKSGRVTLQPLTPYPVVTGTLLLSGGGTLEIDGSLAGVGANGLVLQGSGSIVAETRIHSFDGAGIEVDGNDLFIFQNQFDSNGGAGVSVVSGDGNTIAQNSIFDNGGLGIDLNADGVTENDAGDVDVGPNGLQNAPTIDVATAENGHFEGNIMSLPNTTYTIELFVSPTCDASGYGEGATVLGDFEVTTDGLGSAGFDVSLAPVTIGEAITATATGPDGTSEFSNCFFAVSTDIERDEDAEIPTGYELFQNYPNPFNPVTNIRFAVSNREWVNLEVYNILGKRVATLVDGYVEPGEFTVEFDAFDLPSGIYLYRMTAGSFTVSKQLTLLK